VIPLSTVVLAIGPVTVLAVLAVAVLLTLLILGTAAEIRDWDAMRDMDPVLPLHPPLAPPDREAHQEAA
jgi:hypothetical protein